ncbi:O-antigen ligase family protein [Novosphingobium sp.]|uniref:O-antigen ligase family protein n=1 Tax=Novosphingobium sp. TaxID=1874826 RepID=UPI0025F8D4E5|nr:O-antigen ligase family protein [Novosphingobium sp.]
MIEAHLASDRAAEQNPRGLLAALLIGLAMIFGGGGSTAPASELALEAFAAAILVGGLWLDRSRALWRAPRSLWIIVALAIAVPTLQLVPLPPAIWHRLPGHDVERAALALVGQADSWRAWSVAPSRTLAALLSLGPCLLVMVMTAGLARTGRTQIVAMVAAIGGLALLIGAAQLAGGDAGAFRFYGTRSGNLEGFQANRNHAADVLLIAMVAFAAAAREWQKRWRPVQAGPALSGLAPSGLASSGLAFPAAVVGVTALFSIATIVTASRAGAALLPLGWLGVLLVIRPWLRFDRRALVALALVAVIAALAGAWFVQHNHVIARIAARFTFDQAIQQEFRPRIWADSLYAAQAYFPFGSGMGTFVPVFQAIERLENVDVFLTNRAHNDYLELAIEGGIAALGALLIIVAIILRRAAASIRRPPAESMPQVVFALVTLTVIALHSLVDYPLRSMSLQCLAGLAVGLLMASSDSQRNRPGQNPPGMPRETASMKDEL